MPADAGFQPGFLTRCSGPEAVRLYFHRVRLHGRLAHAYLFAGPPGSGKKAMAVDLAAALHCPSGEPCGRCPSCRSAASGNHPSIVVYSGVDQKASLDIAEVRLISSQDRLSRPGLMVWIIDAVERMSIPATNALLKTLEEPRPGALLLLLAPSAGALLPTIVSRCHRIPFPGARRPAASGAEAPFWREILKPEFLAECDPSDWLSRRFPDASTAREPVIRLVEDAIADFEDRLLAWESGGRTGGVDPVPALQELLLHRSYLDANINADLVLEAVIRLARRNFLS